MTDSPQLIQARGQADQLGVKYHHNAKQETITQLIDDHLSALNEAAAERLAEKVDDSIHPLTAIEYQKKTQKEARRHVGSLVRVRVQCHNPTKKSWAGEILSVGSAKLGTFKKYVPFDAEEGYHIPKIIYEMMKEKKCTIFLQVKDRFGNMISKGRQRNEYTIELLEPLTLSERDELRRKQQLRKRQDD
jgi:hypothetical protein